MSNFLLSQICGLIALMFAVWSFFVTDKIKFLVLQIFVNIFYALSFLFVNAVAGGVLTIIAIVRCVYLIFEHKYNLKSRYVFLGIFIAMCVIVTIIFWQSYLDIVPLITCTLYTIGYAIRNMQTMRYVLLIPSILLIIYCIIITAYTSALLDVFEMITILIAIFHFRKSGEDCENATQKCLDNK